jgi:4-hydroxy-tetrahydrodipicolinate synthase
MPTTNAVLLARDAAQAGAAAISAIPPTYYRHDMPGIFEYYRSIAQATDLPLFIYNNPTATGTPLSGEQSRSDNWHRFPLCVGSKMPRVKCRRCMTS